MEMLKKLKFSIKEFGMTDLGELHHFFGIEAHQSRKGIFMAQKVVQKKF